MNEELKQELDTLINNYEKTMETIRLFSRIPSNNPDSFKMALRSKAEAKQAIHDLFERVCNES